METLKSENRNLKLNLQEVNELSIRLQQRLDAEIVGKANSFAQ